MITHGNLMTLILKYFDEQFGFEDWEGLTYPDVYELTVSNGGKKRLTRIWEQER